MANHHLYNISSVMVAISGVLLIIISTWILADIEDLLRATEDIKDNLKIEMARESFQDYYSIFNKRGGWLNLIFLMLGISITQVSLSFWGCCGVHRKTSFLLLTFISFLVISIILQLASFILTNRRNLELKQFYHLSTSRASISRFHFQEKKMLLALSLVWSLSSLLTSVSALIVRQNQNNKRDEGTIAEVNV